MMRPVELIVALALLSGSPVRGANNIPTSGTTILGSLDQVSNRVHLILVGDGFREEDLPTFRESCDKLVENFFKHAPYDRYKHLFAVTRVDVTSNATMTAIAAFDGSGNPLLSVLQDAAGGWNTPYRAWMTNDGSGQADEWPWVSDETFAEKAFFETLDGVKRDLTVCMLNHPAAINGIANGDAENPYTCIGYEAKYGPDNDPWGYGYQKAHDWGVPEVFAHEFGHAFADLEDEYSADSASNQRTPSSASANITNEADATKVKWIKWKDKFTGYGHHPGAGTQSTGWWRPKDVCKMKVHQGYKGGPVNAGGVNNTYDLCPICQERIVQAIYEKVSLIERADPEPGFVFALAQAIEVDTLAPEGIRLEGDWLVDGTSVPDAMISRTESAAGPQFEADLIHMLPQGIHVITFLCRDRTPILPDIDEDEEPVATYPASVAHWYVGVVLPQAPIKLVREVASWIAGD